MCRARAPTDPFASSVVDDAVVTHTVVDPSVVPVQSRALRRHATQVVVGDGWYALSNHVVSRLAGREGYRPDLDAGDRPAVRDLVGEHRERERRPLDPARFRQAMGRLAAGVTVLTTFAEGTTTP